MKSLLDRCLTHLKRSHEDTANSHPKEIKKFKFEEHHGFKKKGNEDQCRFNLEKGQPLSERQKHIILA